MYKNATVLINDIHCVIGFCMCVWCACPERETIEPMHCACKVEVPKS